MNETGCTSCTDDNMSHRATNAIDEIIKSLELIKEKYTGKYVLVTQNMVITPSFGCFIK